MLYIYVSVLSCIVMMRVCYEIKFTTARFMLCGEDTVIAVTLIVKSLFFPVEHGVCIGVIIHFHLPVYLHVFPAGFNIGKQLVDGFAKVGLLFEKNVQAFLRCICACVLLWRLCA